MFFDGESACSLASVYGAATDSCTITVIGYSGAELYVEIDSDSWPQEGQLDVEFPDGSSTTETWSADTSFTYNNHSGTEVQPVAGEVMLLNGGGATVSLDVSSYHTGVVDDDDDNDGFLDDDDAFPTDADEHDDLDSDGIGSNSDTDDDGDGVYDWNDDFPRHGSADTDSDGDGMPDDIGFVNGAIHEDWSIGNFTGSPSLVRA